MGFTKIKNDFKTAALANGFNGFKHGFLSSMNDGDIDYDFMLLTPPTKKRKPESDYRSFEIILYVSAKNEFEGEETNEDEMTDVWDSLDTKIENFCDALPDDYIIETDVITKPNAHAFNDDVILHQVLFTVRLDIYC